MQTGLLLSRTPLTTIATVEDSFIASTSTETQKFLNENRSLNAVDCAVQRCNVNPVRPLPRMLICKTVQDLLK